MPLNLDAFPFSTPYDPTEDPPGSIDPLGTLSYSERLADILLPGFTARMWRPRLLTFAAASALIADRAVRLAGKEEIRTEARLAFERLFVTSVMLLEKTDPVGFPTARRRLPGSRLARSALAKSEPLTPANFLKGQSVNGPYGVVARLGRNLELIDEDGDLGRNGHDLLAAWSDEQALTGVLDDDHSSNGVSRNGARWVHDVTKVVVGVVEKHEWPRRGHDVWEDVSKNLRPDEASGKEKTLLIKMLKSEPTRCRVIELLCEKKVLEVFKTIITDQSRSDIERTVLQESLHKMRGLDVLDRVIRLTVKTIENYERACTLFQNTFDGLIWSLKQRGGQGAPEEVLGDTRAKKVIDRAFRGLPRVMRDIDQTLKDLSKETTLDKIEILKPLSQIREEALAGSSNVPQWVDVVLGRHERVQREKGKGTWIDRQNHWYLMPGFGIERDEPPQRESVYLHPYRIINAYSFLSDLGLVRLEMKPDEEDS